MFYLFLFIYEMFSLMILKYSQKNNNNKQTVQLYSIHCQSVQFPMTRILKAVVCIIVSIGQCVNFFHFCHQKRISKGMPSIASLSLSLSLWVSLCIYICHSLPLSVSLFPCLSVSLRICLSLSIALSLSLSVSVTAFAITLTSQMWSRTVQIVTRLGGFLFPELGKYISRI